MDHLSDGLPFAGKVDQGAPSVSQQDVDKSYAGHAVLAQRVSSRKLLFSSARLLGVTFASLAVAHLILHCFHLRNSTPAVVPQGRALAAGSRNPCASGYVPDDEAEDDSRADEARGQQPLIQQEDTPEIYIRIVGDAQPQPEKNPAVEVAVGEDDPGEGTSSQCSSQGTQATDNRSWEEDGLPEDIKEKVLDLFQRMIEVSLLCKNLLPMLANGQRLRITYNLVRLFSLDVGAIYWVGRELEPVRASVGHSLNHLIYFALQRSGKDHKQEDRRVALRRMMELITELKQPHYLNDGNELPLYLKKLNEVLQTAALTTKLCFGVLNGLLQMKRESYSKLPDRVVDQQATVLQAMYHSHSEQISRDFMLRRFILICQKRKSVTFLLTRHHYQTYKGVVSEVTVLLQQIIDAVRNAGGLLQQQYSLAAPDRVDDASIIYQMQVELQRELLRANAFGSRNQPESTVQAGADFAGCEAPPAVACPPWETVQMHPSDPQLGLLEPATVASSFGSQLPQISQPPQFERTVGFSGFPRKHPLEDTIEAISAKRASPTFPQAAFLGTPYLQPSQGRTSATAPKSSTSSGHRARLRARSFAQQYRSDLVATPTHPGLVPPVPQPYPTYSLFGSGGVPSWLPSSLLSSVKARVPPPLTLDYTFCQRVGYPSNYVMGAPGDTESNYQETDEDQDQE
ncbi:hypothetical protein, conserved [Eimeria necatrix]|uniref:Uncharacterized protein n=1 Tax=Eimeria necatrix TaxID=51315 RepID=U6N2N5_9EIME|nr:hypothetical protein, conserved [Eimeria necatrix]CDJ69544.1 hypothetical protein, conserved [Eimeria necatrix]